MATLTIEGIPADLLERLVRRAADRGRCVNSEVILSLVQHLRAGAPTEGVRCRAGDAPRSGTRSPERRGDQPGRRAAWGGP